jgi:hypothetical protein
MIRPNQQPQHPLAHCARLLAALALVAALPGCAGKPAAVPSSAPSASPTPSVNAAVAQQTAKVLQVYDDFYKQLIVLETTGDVAKARTELPKYTVDPLRTQLLLELRQYQSAGLHEAGRPVWSAKVTQINLDKTPWSATIESCYDATNYNLVDAKGKAAGIPGQAKRYVVTAKAEMYGDGNWYLQTSQADRERTC